MGLMSDRTENRDEQTEDAVRQHTGFGWTGIVMQKGVQSRAQPKAGEPTCVARMPIRSPMCGWPAGSGRNAVIPRR